jgi:hypothetical protein
LAQFKKQMLLDITSEGCVSRLLTNRTDQCSTLVVLISSPTLAISFARLAKH